MEQCELPRPPSRLDRIRKTLPRVLPFLSWWPMVNRRTLRADLWAGLTGAVGHGKTETGGVAETPPEARRTSTSAARRAAARASRYATGTGSASGSSGAGRALP